jgi:hypothetical protein
VLISTGALLSTFLVGFVMQTGEPIKRVTAQAIMSSIREKGADAVLRELFDSPQWETVLSGIGGGGAGWLRVAAALKPSSDAHTSEDLNCAMSEALRRDAPGALRLVRDGPFDITDVCAWLGFHSFSEELDGKKVQKFIEQGRTAVKSVADPTLTAIRTDCLAELDRIEKERD